MQLAAVSCQGVLDALPDAVLLLDERARVCAINSRARQVLGRRADELLERSALEFVIDEAEGVLDYLGRASASGSPLPGKLTLRTPDGPTVVGTYAAAVPGDDKRLVLVRCVEQPATSEVLRTLEERLLELRSELERERKLQSEMHQALAERDTLLSEVHHRVRNNLQVITSFLNLQMSKHGPGEARDVLREAQARIQALALVHNQLYRESNLDQIDVARLLPSLSQNVIKIYGAMDRVTVSTSLFAWPLTVARASPLALLVTEAVTNSLKHGFPDGQSGTIRLEAWQDDGRPVLRIADDGVGLAADLGSSDRRSIGFDVMHALAAQLGGRLEIKSEGGVAVELTFDTPLHAAS